MDRWSPRSRRRPKGDGIDVDQQRLQTRLGNGAKAGGEAEGWHEQPPPPATRQERPHQGRRAGGGEHAGEGCGTPGGRQLLFQPSGEGSEVAVAAAGVDFLQVGLPLPRVGQVGSDEGKAHDGLSR